MLLTQQVKILDQETFQSLLSTSDYLSCLLIFVLGISKTTIVYNKNEEYRRFQDGECQMSRDIFLEGGSVRAFATPVCTPYSNLVE